MSVSPHFLIRELHFDTQYYMSNNSLLGNISCFVLFLLFPFSDVSLNSVSVVSHRPTLRDLESRRRAKSSFLASGTRLKKSLKRFDVNVLCCTLGELLILHGMITSFSPVTFAWHMWQVIANSPWAGCRRQQEPKSKIAEVLLTSFNSDMRCLW